MVILYCSRFLDQSCDIVAVDAFTIVIKLTLKSRQNDKKIIVLLSEMRNMMAALSE